MFGWLPQTIAKNSSKYPMWKNPLKQIENIKKQRKSTWRWNGALILSVYNKYLRNNISWKGYKICTSKIHLNNKETLCKIKKKNTKNTSDESPLETA